MVNHTKRGEITFSYENDSLFNDVSLLSAYMAKNIVSEAGSMLDEFCITEDEREIYNECLKQSLPNVYEAVMRIASCSDGAFSDGTGENETTVKMSLIDNSAYNHNVLTLIDSTLHNCIKYGVLVEFYSICINDGLYRIAKEKFDTNLFQLKQRLFQLKKKSVSSQL